MGRHDGWRAEPELDEHFLLRFVNWVSRLFPRQFTDQARVESEYLSLLSDAQEILTWPDFLGEHSFILSFLTV